MQTINHHLGILTVVDDFDLTIELHSSVLVADIQKTMKMIVDYAILEEFIPSSNYRVNITNRGVEGYANN